MAEARDPDDLTVVLEAANRGDPQAAAQLLPLVYDQLRRLAASRLANLAPGQTLQATALVHEAYMKLVGAEDPGWNGRGHFFGAAARAMRNILVDQARRKARPKHGGDRRQVADPADLAIRLDASPHDVLELDEALGRLERVDPRREQVVMLRFFAGLEPDQIAAMMGVSSKTVARDWRFARSWLQSELAHG